MRVQELKSSFLKKKKINRRYLLDIHRDRKWAAGCKVWSCGEIRGRATNLAVVGILMIFRAMSPGVVSWVEGVAKERRG